MSKVQVSDTSHLESKMDIADYMAAKYEEHEEEAWISPLGIVSSLNFLTDLVGKHRPCSEDYRIADIGCGTGNLTEALASTYSDASIVGMDLSFVAASFAKKKVLGKENTLVLGGDAIRLLPKLDDFDFIYAVNMVQDTPHPLHTLETLAANLNSGGYLALTVPGEEALEVFPDHADHDDELGLPFMEIEGINMEGKHVDWKQYVLPQERVREIASNLELDVIEEGEITADASGMPHIMELINNEEKKQMAKKVVEKQQANPENGPTVDFYLLQKR